MESYNWFLKGNQYIKEKKYDRAIHCYNESIKLNPNKYTPWYNLGIAYIHINLDPIYHITFFLINFFSLKSNPYYLEDKTIECFKNSIKINPNFIDAWYNLGVFYFEIEDFEKAIKCFKEILKKDSKNLNALDFLSKIYREIKEFELELECLKKIIKLEHKKSNLSIKKIRKRVNELQKTSNKN
ncbi:MAG: tetratricopeptide repeat protein [Candidatus Helarchaeota archaeon]